MSIDEDVKARLVQLAEDLMPLPDPHGRLRRRYRRSKQRRYMVFSASLVAVVMAFGYVAMPRPGEPALVGDPDAGTLAVLKWAQVFADSPPVGELGKTASFNHSLRQAILTKQQSGGYEVKQSIFDVRVLYADDVGPYRVAYVLFMMASPPSGEQWPHLQVTFAAAAGADIETLTQASAIVGQGGALNPYVELNIAPAQDSEHVTVALAPVGCQFWTAAMPQADAWSPEPTRSYLVRTASTRRAEWWRVTCEGGIKEEKPAPCGFGQTLISEQDYARATAQTRGRVDREQAMRDLAGFYGGFDCNGLKSAPYLLWSGPVRGADPDVNGSLDGTVSVVVGEPIRGGGWTGDATVWYDAEAVANGSLGRGNPFAVSYDPRDPSSMLAIAFGQNTGNVLIIAPAGAVTVRAGGIQATVTAGSALLKVSGPRQVLYEALDGSGKVIGTAQLAAEGGFTGSVMNWHKP